MLDLDRGFNNNVRDFDEYQLSKSIHMLADLVGDGIAYRKNRNDNIQFVSASTQAHRLAMEFIKERGLEKEFRDFVENKTKSSKEI